MSLSRILLATTMTLSFSTLGLAQGIYRPVPIPPRPGPAPSTSSSLQLRSHKIDANVRDEMASYRVDQVFYNPSNRVEEGVYLFPVPAGAISRGIRLVIDNKEVAGEILEAGQASAIYREIVRKARDPALLEYVDQGLVRASIFPIAPRSEVKVTLEFSTALERVGDLSRIKLPLRFAAKSSAAVTVDVKVKTSHPLSTLYSPTHPVEVTRSGEHNGRATFEGKATSDSDFSLYLAQDDGPLGISLLTHRSPAQDGTFLLVLAPRAAGDQGEPSPRDVVFVVDRSGSMAGEKWTQATNALRFGLKTLRPRDRFLIVSFATDVRLYKPTLVSATADEIAGALAHLDQLRPAGGTNIGEALKEAFGRIRDESGRLPMITFLTDGIPTVGLTETAQIIDVTKQQPGNARLFAFGLGFDVNTLLLDRLAEENHGDSDYVDEGVDLEVPVSAFFAKVAEPTLIAPTLEVEGIEVYDIYPPRLGDLFAGSSILVTGRYRGDGKATVRLAGRRGDERHVFATEVVFAKTMTDNPELDAIWASRKVGYLLNEIRLHGANAELTDEVLRLGREYGIVTPYTSGLVVEEGTQLSLAAGFELNDRLREARRDASSLEAKARDDLEELEIDDTWAGRGGAQAPSGEAAVRTAKAIKNLSSSVSHADADLFAAAPETYGVSTQRIGGRRFVEIQGVLIDADFRPEMRPKMRIVELFSDEWFQLVETSTELRNLLARSCEMLLLVGDVPYWIRSAR